MQVNDVMTRDVECISPDATLQDAALRMRDLNVGALPVCGKNDRLAGMVTDRDVILRAVAEGRDARKTKVQDVMTPEIIYCFEDQDIADAALIMKDNQVRRLAVLNSDKRLVGILSLGDLAVRTRDEELCGQALEQISEPAMPMR